jgi:hypothetical protein
MPQIKLATFHPEFADSPEQRRNFQSLQEGLSYGEWVPTLTNINTPDGPVRYAYQLCGKACFFTMYLSYVTTIPVWTATPSITLPFQADITASGVGLIEGVFPVYDRIAPILIGYAKQNGAAAPNRIDLPVYAPGVSAKNIHINGFFWVKV